MEMAEKIDKIIQSAITIEKLSDALLCRLQAGDEQLETDLFNAHVLDDFIAELEEMETYFWEFADDGEE